MEWVIDGMLHDKYQQFPPHFFIPFCFHVFRPLSGEAECVA